MTAKRRKTLPHRRRWYNQWYWYDQRFPTVGFGASYRASRSGHGLRARYRKVVDDPSLLPAPLPPRPPRRDKRRPSKPR